MILVTGATGGLGALIVERLAGQSTVIAGTRTPHLVPTGTPTTTVDFDDPDTLPAAFAGAETLLLVSAGYGEDDVVIARHAAAIDAAEQAGVAHIIYTSLTGAGDHLTFALAHRWTERRLQNGSTDWTILRNGLYAELLASLAAPNPDGVITAPLGTGRLAAVARRDLAEVAASVAARPSIHIGQTYELVGEQAIGATDVIGAYESTTSYEPASVTATRQALTGAGLPSFQIPMLMSIYAAIAGGFLDNIDSDLRRLLGRPPQPALDAIANALTGRTAKR